MHSGRDRTSFAHWSRLADGFAADAPVAEKTDPIAKRKMPISTSFVLKCAIFAFEACLLMSAPSRRPNNTTTRRRIPASDKHDLWIRFQKTSPAGALPFLRTTDQAVSHLGYTWQDAETYSDATPLSTALTRPKDLICACYPGSWGFLTVLVGRCTSVHLVDIRLAREQNPALRVPWADGLNQ